MLGNRGQRVAWALPNRVDRPLTRRTEAELLAGDDDIEFDAASRVATERAKPRGQSVRPLTRGSRQPGVVERATHHQPTGVAIDDRMKLLALDTESNPVASGNAVELVGQTETLLSSAAEAADFGTMGVDCGTVAWKAFAHW